MERLKEVEGFPETKEALNEETHAYQLVVAQRLSPDELIRIYGPETASQIAINILCPPLLSQEKGRRHPGETQALIEQMVSGTPNYHYNPIDPRSYLLELTSRLKVSNSIFEKLPDNLAKNPNFVRQIHYLWKERLLSTSRGDEKSLDKTMRSFQEQLGKFGGLTRKEEECAELFADFAKTMESLPEMTIEKRRAVLEEIGRRHYGMELPEALDYFEKYKNQIEGSKDTESKLPSNTRVADVIEMVCQDYENLLGDDIDLQSHIIVTTPEEDPNLLRFPAYYYPGRGAIFNKEDTASLETFHLAYHEIMHLIIDIYNQKSESNRAKGRELALHRAIPDPQEEVFARLAEDRALYLGMLMGVEGNDLVREKTILLRAQTDIALNIEGENEDKVRLELQKQLPEKVADMIIGFAKLRPGNYLFGYLALPEKLKEMVDEKSLRSTQRLKAVLAKIKEGDSWKKNVLETFKNLPKGGAYAELENLPENSPWKKIEKLFKELPGMSFEKRLALASHDPYHALLGQKPETWKEILARLIETKELDAGKDVPINPNEYKGFTRVLAFLEEDVNDQLIESVESKAFYSSKQDSENPRTRLLGQLEVLFLFSLDKKLKGDAQIQSLVLDYIYNSLSLYHTDKLDWQEIPAYRLRKAASYARQMKHFIRGIEWDLDLQEKTNTVQASLTNTADKFDQIAKEVVGSIRVQKDVFSDYVKQNWGVSVEEMEEGIERKIDTTSQHLNEWHGFENRTALVMSVLGVDKLPEDLGLPFTTDVQLLPSGEFTTLAGASYVLPIAQMNLTPDLGNIAVEQVASGMTKKELENISLQELETLTIVNIVNDVSEHLLLRNLCESEEEEIAEGDYYKRKTQIMEGVVKILADRYPDLSSETLGSVQSYLKFFQDKTQGINGSGIRVAGEKGEYAHSINLKNPDRKITRVEWVRRLREWSEPIFQLVSSLPPDHPVSDLLTHTGITTGDQEALGKSYSSQETIKAMENYYRKTSTALWMENYLSGKTIRQPLLPIISPLIAHEVSHGAFQAAKMVLDPEFRLPSTCYYGPSFESYPTYNAYRRILNQGNNGLAGKYLLFNLLRAKADLLLNHSHQPMAKVWERYSEYMPPGEAAERVQYHIESLRNSPGSGLFYVGDFDAWNRLYHHFRSEINLSEQETNQALLLFSRYRPQKVLEAIERYPEEIKSLKDIFS